MKLSIKPSALVHGIKSTVWKHLINLPKGINLNSKTFFFFFLDICYAFNKDLARFQAYLFVKAELKAKALKVVRKTV